ncbi:bifunctional diguanylate cyclase/phosphodiesterase [Roseateles sp.]|uniref:bifunctional diguanylate cyclase/phosphodiesterase n=1 Tax=Roseateles sp. TaxID=1971397 RepID=UPI003BA5B5BC
MQELTFHRRSVRQRIVLLAVLAFVPMALLLTASLYADWRRTETEAHGRLQLLAEPLARAVEGQLQRAQTQLSHIASRPQVRALNSTGCAALMTNPAGFSGDFSGELIGLALFDRESRLVCSFLSRESELLSAAWASGFKEALAQEAFIASPALQAPQDGRWMTVWSVPVVNEAGHRVGLLRAALDLMRWNQEVMTGLAPQVSVKVIDQKGQVLLSSENLARQVGTRVEPSDFAAPQSPGQQGPSSATAPAGQAGPGKVRTFGPSAAGFFLAPGSDGEAWLNYSRPVAGTEWRVWVSMSEAELFAEHRQRRLRLGLLALAAAGLTFALAVYLGRRLSTPLRVMREQLTAAVGDAAAAPMAGTLPDEMDAVAQQLQALLDAHAQATSALRESQASYQNLLLNTPDLIVSIDERGHFTFVNSAAEALLGLNAEDCVGQSALSFIHEDDREATLHTLRVWLESGANSVQTLENRQRGRLGHFFWVQWHVCAVRGALGEVQRLTCIGRDISPMREQQRLFNDTQAVAHIGSWRIDIKTGDRIWSQETYQLYGLAQGAPLPPAFGPEFQQLFDVEDREAVLAWFGACIAGRSPGGIEFRVHPSPGVCRWLQAFGALERDADGEPLSLLGTVQDITERKAAEERLRQAQLLNGAVMDALTEQIAVLDAQGVIVAVNRAWREFARSNGAGELAINSMGLNYLDVCHGAQGLSGGDEALRALCGIDEVLKGQRSEFALEYPCHSPTQRRWFRMRAFPIQAQEGGAVVSHEEISERWLAEEALAQSEARFKGAFDCAAVGMALVTPQGAWLRVNAKLCQMFGYSEAEMMQTDFKQLSLPEDLDLDLLEMRRVLRGEIDSYVITKRYHHRKGHLLWGLLSVAVVKDETGRVLHLVTQVNDISEQKRAEQALMTSQGLLKESAQHTQAILDHMEDGVIGIDTQGLIISFNQAASDIFGYAPEEVLGRNVSLLMPEPHRSHPDQYLSQYAQSGEVRMVGRQRELEGLRKDGRLFPMLLSVSELLNEGASTYVGLVRDVSFQRQLTEEMHRLAFFDALTGLPNRRLFLDRLNQSLLASERSGEHGALMLLDLDHFKLINDSVGHEAGDQLLQQVAERLRTHVRESESIARLGGDEFVVLLQALSTHHVEAAKEVEQIADRLLQALAQPYEIGTQPHDCTPSIGIVVFKGDAEGWQELLKKADVAMYQAKSGGRNRACFYDPVLQAAAAERQTLARDMQRGLAEQEFVLHYQIQVNAHGAPDGAEALIRWRHPVHGLMSPLFFIPLAEETGLILPLGQWVLEAACDQLRRWADEPSRPSWALAVNVSAIQLAQPDFVDTVAAALRRSGANPFQLKLELTESMLVSDVEEVISKMRAIKTMGVGFSLDDFGTGYSSLSILKRLPLDQLKIDQSFVRDLLTDPNDVVIARTVLALGQSLGLKVIAEGVENVGQLEVLAKMGCQAFQGYYFGRPQAIQDLLPLKSLHPLQA